MCFHLLQAVVGACRPMFCQHHWLTPLRRSESETYNAANLQSFTLLLVLMIWVTDILFWQHTLCSLRNLCTNPAILLASTTLRICFCSSWSALPRSPSPVYACGISTPGRAWRRQLDKQKFLKDDADTDQQPLVSRTCGMQLQKRTHRWMMTLWWLKAPGWSSWRKIKKISEALDLVQQTGYRDSGVWCNRRGCWTGVCKSCNSGEVHQEWLHSLKEAISNEDNPDEAGSRKVGSRSCLYERHKFNNRYVCPGQFAQLCHSCWLWIQDVNGCDGEFSANLHPTMRFCK